MSHSPLCCDDCVHFDPEEESEGVRGFCRYEGLVMGSQWACDRIRVNFDIHEDQTRLEEGSP